MKVPHQIFERSPWQIKNPWRTPFLLKGHHELLSQFFICTFSLFLWQLFKMAKSLLEQKDEASFWIFFSSRQWKNPWTTRFPWRLLLFFLGSSQKRLVLWLVLPATLSDWGTFFCRVLHQCFEASPSPVENLQAFSIKFFSFLLVTEVTLKNIQLERDESLASCNDVLRLDRFSSVPPFITINGMQLITAETHHHSSKGNLASPKKTRGSF